jgi:hypothetical protein
MAMKKFLHSIRMMIYSLKNKLRTGDAFHRLLYPMALSPMESKCDYSSNVINKDCNLLFEY